MSTGDIGILAQLLSQILVVTLGTKPQLATLPLHLLANRGVAVDAIWLVHPHLPTQPAFAQAIQQLNSTLPALFPSVQVRFVPLPNSDVDSPAGIQALMDCLYGLFAEIKRAEGVIHFGIAGGRRTMGMFGMVAAQLLFDERDRIWHIHSSAELEASRRLLPADGDVCYLVEVPVVRWGSLSPIFSERLSNAHSLAQALQAQKDLRLQDKFLLARVFIEEILTPGEARVLAVAQEGVETLAIAERLSSSVATVETHLGAIFRKARVHWEVAELTRMGLIRLVSLYYELGGNHGFP
ncbi:MAG TPA: CRISPR-associated ring nuclease [Anaerolineales bacterium]|nr:CRISPR-associated ring nuclease [Anaerolineales bacterium]